VVPAPGKAIPHLNPLNKDAVAVVKNTSGIAFELGAPDGDAL